MPKNNEPTLRELLQRPEKDHRVSKEQVFGWIKAFRAAKTMPTTVHRMAWPLSVLRAIRQVPGAAGVGEHFGCKPDGSLCTILVALDEDGRDLWEAGLWELSHPCPPWCGPETA